MGVHDAPQWLISAFIRTCVGAGSEASRGELETAVGRLLRRWAESGRVHHNVKHLVDVLAKVDQIAEETHDPDLVRLAAWYHGAVFSSSPRNSYAQRGGEDEVASAELAVEELTALRVPEENVRRVEEIVRGIARHRGEGDVDIEALCDAELATLAVEPQRYSAYRKHIREEYAHIPQRDYLIARIAILTKLLGRKRLFASPFGQQWEDPARQNLSAELQQLKDELKGLAAGEGIEAPSTAELPAVALDEPQEIDSGRLEDTAMQIERIQTAVGGFGRSSAESVSAAQRVSRPVIKRHEKTPGEREGKLDLPGRS